MPTQDMLKARGNDAFNVQHFDEAIDWYTKAIAVDPDGEATAAIYSNRAAVHTRMGNHAEAVKDADECIRVRPEWLKGHYRKGTALEALGSLHESLEAFEAALKAQPNNEEVQVKVRAVRDRIHDREDAAAHSTYGPDESTTKPHLVRSAGKAKVMANMLFASGKYELAMEYYGRAIELGAAQANTTPEDRANDFAGRAACRHQLEDYAGAVADATAALELCPGHVKALLRRAIAFEAMERWQTSLDDYQQLHRLSPEMSDAARGIARCERALQ